MAGGSDREGGGSGPVVVLMHGFGAPGADLVPLFRQLSVPADVRFVFPEAPLALGPGYGGGRAWWMIDIEALQQAVMRGQRDELVQRLPEGLGEARALVNGMLEALAKDHQAPLGRIVLGGFSQGAMLATDVALRAPEAPAGLVVLSGSLITEAEWRGLLAKRTALPVLQSHGRTDPILPFDIAQRLHRHFVDAGLDARWVEFNGGHGIPNGVVDAISEFVGRVVSD